MYLYNLQQQNIYSSCYFSVNEFFLPQNCLQLFAFSFFIISFLYGWLNGDVLSLSTSLIVVICVHLLLSFSLSVGAFFPICLLSVRFCFCLFSCVFIHVCEINSVFFNHCKWLGCFTFIYMQRKLKVSREMYKNSIEKEINLYLLPM